jgi:hypothetical protein
MLGLKIAGIVLVIVLALVGLSRCQHPTPPAPPAVVVTAPTPMALPHDGPPTPPPAAVATTAVRTHIVIERPVYYGPNGLGPSVDVGASGAILDRPLMERIEIDTTADAGATAPVVVPTAPPLPVATITTTPKSEHSRLGILVATLPGVLAVDVEALSVRPLQPLARFNILPADLMTLEVGLDIEANHKQVGALLTTGGKVFVGVGYYGSYDLNAGPFGACGMRF